MDWGRSFAALILLLQLELAALGMEQRMERQFEHCCSLGTSWVESGLKCEKFTGPVSGVPPVEQGLCLEAVDICCVKAYHEKQCGLGKNNARKGQACATNSKSSGDYLRDCCQGCKLGILTGSMGQGCAFNKFAFGKPWDPAFLECCHEVSPSSTVPATSSTVDNSSKLSTSVTDGLPTSRTSFTLPTPPLDDICLLMKDLLCSDICIPTPGSYICDCREGFTLLEDGKTCVQNSPVDRCKKNNPCEHRCLDTGEAIVCTCEPGFTLASDKRSCVKQPASTTASSSENELDSRCPIGFRYNPTSQVCNDVDECESRVCPGRCENTIGSYNCVMEPAENVPAEACPPGFQWDPQVKNCIDIDECEVLAGVCDAETHVCVNTIGSFTCHELTGTGPKSCPAGFKFDREASICKDVDECAEGIHGCNPDSEKCRNSHGAYFCDIKCKEGFTFSDNSGTCIDVDECTVNGSQLCPGPGSHCVNTPGSYKCSSSNVSNVVQRCPAGYKPTTNPAEPCIDVNECNEQVHACSVMEKCVNKIGGYKCEALAENSVEEGEDISEEYDKSGYREYPSSSRPSDVGQDEDLSVAEPTCFPGYKYNYDTDMCDDVDECLTNEHNCTGLNLDCINVQGSFRCECQSGYEMNITTHKCHDVDECARGLTECSRGERCVNTIGGHQCSPACSSGFQPHPSIDSLCQDINECDLGIHSCPVHSHICVNTNGSYVCDVAPLCREGYKRDAASGECVDIDECKSGPGCREHEQCRNSPGSYDCTPLCGPGWLFAPATKSCQDVDECLLGRHNCPQGTHSCKNVDGNFTCELIAPCENGYRRAVNGSCVDVDECAENVHNCLLRNHQYCANREGSFECVTRLPGCDAGFEFSLRTGRCEDVDECRDGRNRCDDRLRERCVNLMGSYRCERPPQAPTVQRPACPKGFRYNPHWRNCVDIDECAEGSHNCTDQICYNTPGEFICSKSPSPSQSRPCSEGMKYTRNGCEDINECATLTDACSSNELCINTPGSFTCTCKPGFKRHSLTLACEDINECQLQQNDCTESQRCDNTIGSYSCVRLLPCGTGYTLNAAIGVCEDDDECELGIHDCGTGYSCRNTLGSYRCDRISRRPSTPRFVPIPISTTGLPVQGNSYGTTQRSKIRCPPGYQVVGNQCVDIDECVQLQNSCGQMQRCINTVGSYRCASRIVCGDGYILDDREQRCVDVDECADGSHECGAQQLCENRQGGYMCSCPPGHTIGPNKDCVDMDECSIFEGKVCSINSHCENTIGSYRCVCKPGFESIASGINGGCQDVDECERSPGLCQHRCFNAWGSYRCACDPGFSLNSDNRSCTDIDECEEFKDHNLCVGICQNTPGSYSCRCPEGYRLGSDGRTCQDIDECKTGRECTGQGEICQNTRGSFRCNTINCPLGFQRDTERKNRCLRSTRYCQSGDLACLQLPSHYSFNFITFVSMLPIPPSGQLELFTMRGTQLPGSTVQFKMELVEARAPPGIARATESYFKLRRPAHSLAVLVLARSIAGPQEIELNLSMEIYHRSEFVASAVAKLFIYVSAYEY